MTPLPPTPALFLGERVDAVVAELAALYGNDRVKVCFGGEDMLLPYIYG